MENESIKTTIYLQAIITTNAAPDFSFFNKIADLQNQATLEVATKEESPLLTGVTAEKQQPKTPKQSREREGDPNKPITGPQIGLVKTICEQDKLKLSDVLDAYHVSDVTKLSDADVQSILKESKEKKKTRKNNSDSDYA